jgi:hypothetical protein
MGLAISSFHAVERCPLLGAKRELELGTRPVR